MSVYDLIKNGWQNDKKEIEPALFKFGNMNIILGYAKDIMNDYIIANNCYRLRGSMGRDQPMVDITEFNQVNFFEKLFTTNIGTLYLPKHSTIIQPANIDDIIKKITYKDEAITTSGVRKKVHDELVKVKEKYSKKSK